MHDRFIVQADTVNPVLDFSNLARAFPDRVNFAIEWCSLVKASDSDPEYGVTAGAPYAIGLACRDLNQHNTLQTWDADTSNLLCVLPGYSGSGHYGAASDGSYIESTALSGQTQVGLYSSRGRLQFYLVRFQSDDSDEIAEWRPQHIEPFTFSLVVWGGETPEVQALGTPFYHAWVSSSSRYQGSVTNYRVPFNFKAFEMREGENWMVALNWNSPIRSESGSNAVLLVVDNILEARSGNSSVVACLSRSPRPGETRWYGCRRAVKPAVHRDTIGVPVALPLSRVGDLHIRLLDVRREVITDASEHVFCLTFYRV